MTYLRPLGLTNVRFKVQFKTCRANENGADDVQFLFSANPGESLAPLVDVASGGEMSRFLLALKTVLSEVNGSSILVFDEIDAGVSGKISGTMATLMKKLSTKNQVFCITHQPIIAAAADQHYSVSKSIKDGVALSTVTYLSDFNERQQEIAELAGGDLEKARIYAASLLEHEAA